MNRDHWLYPIAILCGAASWVLVALASGRKEAWDSGLYFSAGIPALCLLSLVLGFLQPQRPWRWGALPFAGQFAAMLLMQGPGSLLPLGIVVFAVLSIPAVITARIGASIATKWAARDDP